LTQSTEGSKTPSRKTRVSQSYRRLAAKLDNLREIIQWFSKFIEAVQKMGEFHHRSKRRSQKSLIKEAKDTKSDLYNTLDALSSSLSEYLGFSPGVALYSLQVSLEVLDAERKYMSNRIRSNRSSVANSQRFSIDEDYDSKSQTRNIEYQPHPFGESRPTPKNDLKEGLRVDCTAASHQKGVLKSPNSTNASPSITSRKEHGEKRGSQSTATASVALSETGSYQLADDEVEVGERNVNDRNSDENLGNEEEIARVDQVEVGSKLLESNDIPVILPDDDEEASREEFLRKQEAARMASKLIGDVELTLSPTTKNTYVNRRSRRSAEHKKNYKRKSNEGNGDLSSTIIGTENEPLPMKGIGHQLKVSSSKDTTVDHQVNNSRAASTRHRNDSGILVARFPKQQDLWAAIKGKSPTSQNQTSSRVSNVTNEKVNASSRGEDARRQRAKARRAARLQQVATSADEHLAVAIAEGDVGSEHDSNVETIVIAEEDGKQDEIMV